MSLLLTLGVAALALLALGGVLLMSLVLAIKYCTPLAAQAKAMEPVWPHYPAIPEETTRSAFAHDREDAFVSLLTKAGARTVRWGNILATCDPAVIKPLLQGRSHTIGRSWLYRLFARVMPYADGILFAADEEWRRRHRAFTPIFSGANIRHYTTAMAEAAVREGFAMSIMQAAVARAQAEVDAVYGAHGQDAGTSAPAASSRVAAILADVEADMLQQLRASMPASRVGVRCLLDVDRNLSLTLRARRDTDNGGGDGARSAPVVVTLARTTPTLHALLTTPCASAPKATLASLDYDYVGPLPENDLLTFVRWIAMRVLATWGFGLQLTAPSEGDATSALPLSLSAMLARSLDDYARTVFERLPHASKPPVLAALYQYGRLHTLGWRVHRITDEVVALVKRGGDDAPTANSKNDALRCTPARSGAAPGATRAAVFASPRRNDVRHAAGVPPCGAPAGADASSTAATAAEQGPDNLLTALLENGFTSKEIASEVNHVHGAHKAVAFTTTAALFELSTPDHAATRAALVDEFKRVCGAPSTTAFESADAMLSQLRHSVPLQSSSTSADGNGSAAAALPLGWRIPERTDLENGSLPVLQRVWKETLRCHVVSLGVVRCTGEPLTDPTTGAQIPPGVDIQVLLHALHMHPQHWGADAAVWNPERWLPGAPNGAQQADVFFPFLDGLRRCAGMYLAELEFAVLLYMCLIVFETRATMPDAGAAAATLDEQDDGHGFRHTAIVPQRAEDGSVTYKLRLRADMFSAFDGRIPFTIRTHQTAAAK